MYIKLPTILYAYRYTGHIETIKSHVDGLNNRVEKMNNKQLKTDVDDDGQPISD